MTKHVALAAALVLAAALPAFAKSPPVHHAPAKFDWSKIDWATLDLDQDGEIAKADFLKWSKKTPAVAKQAEANWAKLDKDKDGMLTDSEIDGFLIAVGAKKPH